MYSNLWRLTFPLFKAFSCFWLSRTKKIYTAARFHDVTFGVIVRSLLIRLHLHIHICLLDFGTFCHSLRSTSTFSNWLCTGNINMKPNIAGVQTGIWFFIFQKSKNTLVTVFVWGLLWHDTNTNSNSHTLTYIHFEFYISLRCARMVNIAYICTEQPEPPVPCSVCLFFVPNIVSAFVLEHQLFFSLLHCLCFLSAIPIRFRFHS